MSRRLPYLGFDDLPRPAPLDQPDRPDGFWFNERTGCFEYWDSGSVWELQSNEEQTAGSHCPLAVAADDIAQGELVAVGLDGRLWPLAKGETPR